MLNGHCECYVLWLIHILRSFSHISAFQIHFSRNGGRTSLVYLPTSSLLWNPCNFPWSNNFVKLPYDVSRRKVPPDDNISPIGGNSHSYAKLLCPYPDQLCKMTGVRSVARAVKVVILHLIVPYVNRPTSGERAIPCVSQVLPAVFLPAVRQRIGLNQAFCASAASSGDQRNGGALWNVR